MLLLNEKYNYKSKELYYFNLMEQEKISIDELKNILNNQSYNEDYFKFSNTAKNNEYFMSSENLSELKESCLYYINAMCNAHIQMGVDVKLSDNENYHFSLSLEDQQNITNAFTISTFRNSSVPYHADGEECRIFSQEDIKIIYETCIMYITQQTTYCNMLKQYIKSCTSKEDVIEAYYSMELPEEYKAKYDEIISHSLDVINI